MAASSTVVQESYIDRLRNGFDKNYWVANILELFERFAFYGSKAVLAYYLANTLGLGPEEGPQLAGDFSFLVYFLPMFAGVFVDRYGFRRMLTLCFFLFTLGYFLIGYAALPAGQATVEAIGKKNYIVAVLVLTAIGGSLIKPCIVGTVERTSKPNYRSLGFSIYYSLVNLGGAIGPVLASPVRSELGIEYVFLVSAATSALMMVGTLLFFREPVPHDGILPEPRSLGKTLVGMLTVFKNFRFISFLLIYSGYWIMFWQVFYSFPFYVDEILNFKRFEILESVDAWTIIIFSVVMTAVTKKIAPMPCMILGFVISTLSWLVIAFSPTIAAAIVGLAIFAIGESTSAPRFYDYVGSLAPKSQVATYMGLAFIPVAVGSLLGGRLGGKLVKLYLRDTVDPTQMWLIVAGIGVATTLLLWGHSKVFAIEERTA